MVVGAGQDRVTARPLSGAGFALADDCFVGGADINPRDANGNYVGGSGRGLGLWERPKGADCGQVGLDGKARSVHQALASNRGDCSVAMGMFSLYRLYGTRETCGLDIECSFRLSRFLLWDTPIV